MYLSNTSMYTFSSNLINFVRDDPGIISKEFEGVKLNNKCSSNMLSSYCIFYLQHARLTASTITVNPTSAFIAPNLLVHYIKINDNIPMIAISRLDKVTQNEYKKTYYYKSNDIRTFDANLVNIEIVKSEFPIEITLMSADDISDETDIYSYEFINDPKFNLRDFSALDKNKKNIINIYHNFLFQGLKKSPVI